MSKIYSVEDVIGKTLFSKRVIPVYRLPTTNSELKRIVETGQNVGTVYSWQKGLDDRNEIWYSLGFDKKEYVQHKEGNYDIEALKEQGVKTVQEKVQEKKEAGMSTADKIFSGVSGYGKKLGTILIVLVVAYFVVKNFDDIKKMYK